MNINNNPKPSASLRAGRLSQDARDILAWAFKVGLPVNERSSKPRMTAAEVRIGPNDVSHILNGGGKFIRHSAGVRQKDMVHSKNLQWAIVYAFDCDGNPERGAHLVQQHKLKGKK